MSHWLDGGCLSVSLLKGVDGLTFSEEAISGISPVLDRMAVPSSVVTSVASVSVAESWISRWFKNDLRLIHKAKHVLSAEEYGEWEWPINGGALDAGNSGVPKTDAHVSILLTGHSDGSVSLWEVEDNQSIRAREATKSIQTPSRPLRLLQRVDPLAQLGKNKMSMPVVSAITLCIYSRLLAVGYTDGSITVLCFSKQDSALPRGDAQRHTLLRKVRDFLVFEGSLTGAIAGDSKTRGGSSHGEDLEHQAPSNALGCLPPGFQLMLSCRLPTKAAVTKLELAVGFDRLFVGDRNGSSRFFF